MLNTVAKTILILGILTTPLSSFAKEARLYLGIDYGDFGYEVTDTGYSPDNANGYILRLGYDLNNWLAVEGHYADPEDFEENGSVAITSGAGFGAYGRLNLRFKQATLYGLAGATRITFDGESATGLAYGAGLDIYGSRNTALTISYTRYFDDEAPSGADIVVDAFNFGITHYFGNVPRIYKRY